MNDDPIVSEVRRVREALWEEAGRDLNRLGELIRRTAAGISVSGPTVVNAEQLRQYAGQRQVTAALHEEPPEYGENSGTT